LNFCIRVNGTASSSSSGKRKPTALTLLPPPRLRATRTLAKKASSSALPSAPSRVSVPVKASEQMVAAGVAVLWGSGAVEVQLGCDKLLVAEIFEAMPSAAPK
jgi:hypothetical protein